MREILGVWVVVATLAARASAEPALPETQLPLRLIGTVVVAQAERSIAVIENGGATSVVRTGDAIGGARVQAIWKDGVVLAQAGRLERLAFASLSAASAAGPGAQSASARARGTAEAGGVAAVDRELRHALPYRRAQAAKAREASATARAAAQPDAGEPGSEVAHESSAEQVLTRLASQARYSPLLDEGGKLRGVALMDIRADSTLARLGLRSGDVVISVAGVNVDNSPRSVDTLRSLDPRAGGEVLVERAGVPTRIEVPPGAL